MTRAPESFAQVRGVERVIEMIVAREQEVHRGLATEGIQHFLHRGLVRPHGALRLTVAAGAAVEDSPAAGA